MKRKTAMMIANSGGDLKWTTVQGRDGDKKWGGFMTRGPLGEYQPLLTVMPKFDTEAEAEEMLKMIVRGAIQLGLDEGWVEEADPILVEMVGPPEKVFTPAPDQPAVSEVPQAPNPDGLPGKKLRKVEKKQRRKAKGTPKKGKGKKGGKKS